MKVNIFFETLNYEAIEEKPLMDVSRYCYFFFYLSCLILYKADFGDCNFSYSDYKKNLALCLDHATKPNNFHETSKDG